MKCFRKQLAFVLILVMTIGCVLAILFMSAAGCTEKETPILFWRTEEPDQILHYRNDSKGCLVSFGNKTVFTEEVLEMVGGEDPKAWLHDFKSDGARLKAESNGYTLYTITRISASGTPYEDWAVGTTEEQIILKFPAGYDYEANMDLLEHAGLAKYYDTRKKCIRLDPQILNDDEDFPYRYTVRKGVFSEEYPSSPK